MKAFKQTKHNNILGQNWQLRNWDDLKELSAHILSQSFHRPHRKEREKRGVNLNTDTEHNDSVKQGRKKCHF